MTGKRLVKQAIPTYSSKQMELIEIVKQLKPEWSHDYIVKISSEDNWNGDAIVNKILEGSYETHDDKDEWSTVSKKKNASTVSTLNHRPEYTRGTSSIRGGRGGRGGHNGRTSVRERTGSELNFIPSTPRTKTDDTDSPKAGKSDSKSDLKFKNKAEKEAKDKEVKEAEKPKKPTWAEMMQKNKTPEVTPEPESTSANDTTHKSQISEDIEEPSPHFTQSLTTPVWPSVRNGQKIVPEVNEPVTPASDADAEEAALLIAAAETARIAAEEALLAAQIAEAEAADRAALEKALLEAEFAAQQRAEAEAAEAAAAAAAAAAAEAEAKRQAEAAAPVEVILDVLADNSKPIVKLPTSTLNPVASGISFGVPVSTGFSFGAPKEATVEAVVKPTEAVVASVPEPVTTAAAAPVVSIATPVFSPEAVQTSPEAVQSTPETKKSVTSMQNQSQNQNQNQNQVPQAQGQTQTQAQTQTQTQAQTQAQAQHPIAPNNMHMYHMNMYPPPTMYWPHPPYDNSYGDMYSFNYMGAGGAAPIDDSYNMMAGNQAGSAPGQGYNSGKKAARKNQQYERKGGAMFYPGGFQPYAGHGAQMYYPYGYNMPPHHHHAQNQGSNQTNNQGNQPNNQGNKNSPPSPSNTANEADPSQFSLNNQGNNNRKRTNKNQGQSGNQGGNYMNPVKPQHNHQFIPHNQVHQYGAMPYYHMQAQQHQGQGPNQGQPGMGKSKQGKKASANNMNVANNNFGQYYTQQYEYGAATEYEGTELEQQQQAASAGLIRNDWSNASANTNTNANVGSTNQNGNVEKDDDKIGMKRFVGNQQHQQYNMNYFYPQQQQTSYPF